MKREEEERVRKEEEERVRREGEEREKAAEAEQRKAEQEQQEEQLREEEERKETEQATSAASVIAAASSSAATDSEQVYDRDGKLPQSEEDQSNDSIAPLSAPVVARSSSSAGQMSLQSPSSPNPSFSSLRARPTPPATSGRSSPTPSMLSSGGGGGGGGGTISLPIPHTLHEDGEEGGLKGGIASASTSFTETGAHDPLKSNPPAAREAEDVQTDKQHEDGGGFFPSALVRAGDGSSLGIDSGARDAGGQSADSDGYGQPSPRGDRHPVPPTPQQAVPFATGYGEVRFGLEASTTTTTTTSADNGDALSTSTSLQQPSEGDGKSTPRIASFQIRVGDPQKVGDPVTAHIVYTVRVKTDTSLFRAAQFSVLRRYSDFRWLHAALTHNNPGIFVPPVPEKVKLGRFAPDLVEARRHGLESCINKIANNPVLQFDEDFKLFLDSQSFHADVKARDQIKGPVPTPEQKTYFGWSTTFTGTTYRYHESDAWFDEQKVYLDHLELQLKTLVRIVSALAQQRKDVAAATSESSHALMMLSGSSLSRALSTCFAGLGEVERRTFELADMQADADVREFGSVLYEYERMVGSARKAFATRIDAWQTWQRLEDELRKVQTKHDKVKRDMQPGSHRAHDGGRLQAVLDELAVAETKCLNAKREFDVIGRRCKEQMDAFEWDRIRAFHDACEVWLQGMIERNQEIMSEWEQYAALLERQTGHSIQDEQ